MKKLYLVTVGSVKDKNILEREKEFTKRINLFDLQLVSLKASGENKDKEGKEILNFLSLTGKKEKLYPVLLTEHGKLFTSGNFSSFVGQKLESTETLCLIIGGNTGFSKEIVEKCWPTVSLSPMTLPHQFAKLVLVEQLYRAQTILTGHPYSK